MTPDYRAMCAELVDDLELADWPSKLKEAFRADIARARALLAKADGPAVPVLPGDVQIIKLAEYTLLVPVARPVPLSERLPGPEDCDEQGRCWMLLKVAGDWRLVNPEKSGLPQLEYGFSHWLPAHALPLPTPDAL